MYKPIKDVHLSKPVEELQKISTTDAVNETIKIIRRDLRQIPRVNYDKIHVRYISLSVIEWDQILSPKGLLEEMPPDGGDDIDTKYILGMYQPMKSPGIITLHVYNLRRFYWSVVKKLCQELPKYLFSRQDMEMLVDFIVLKTWHHEVFHHSMEVTRRLVDGQPYSRDEEPLAVAYSRQCLRGNTYKSNAGRLGHLIFDLAMEITFDAYPPPYKDWPKYDSPERLKRGIADFLQPRNKAFLENSGVPVEDLLYRLIPIEKGFSEQLIVEKAHSQTPAGESESGNPSLL
jgi:hypothetical protein